MTEAINWFNDASPEDREAFLEATGAYPVSKETWYVHPWKEQDGTTESVVKDKLPDGIIGDASQSPV